MLECSNDTTLKQLKQLKQLFMTDPIADMLNRIRNAQAVSKQTVSIPFSKMKYEIADILEKRGFIKEVDKRGRKEKKFIKIILNQEAKINGLKRISRPGQRIYVSAKDVRQVQNGYGIAIISTPKGLMENKEAKKNNLGGEVVCEIW